MLNRPGVRWAVPFVVLALAVAGLTIGSGLLAGRPFDLGAYSSVQFVLNTNAAALASTLGILMAIVLLMVQLTAQRYSFNIIGMFVHNPRNVALVVLFVITISFNIWLAATVDDGYIPEFGTLLALGMGTLCFGLLIPYFAYLFDTLKPHNLLDALQKDALAAVASARRGGDLSLARARAAENVQHTGDIARTAVQLTDADVARHSVWTLFGAFCEYLPQKPSLPPEWFSVEGHDFRGRHALIVKEIEESGTWFEQRILENFQVAFTSSLNRLESVNTTVALCCRLAGERALEQGDEGALRLLMKFFNTFLRASLNARDARAGYHLLYEYALLADEALDNQPELAREIVHRIAYYGETALGMGVLWMAVAAAQDLRTLCEACVTGKLPPETTADIQRELLDLVHESERTQSPARSLLQKAALALGAFHIVHGNDVLATDLARGLAGADAAELAQLARELAAVTEPLFWELTDRVMNFEYVEPEPRARLGDFVDLVAGQRRPGAVAGGKAASSGEPLGKPGPAGGC